MNMARFAIALMLAGLLFGGWACPLCLRKASGPIWPPSRWERGPNRCRGASSPGTVGTGRDRLRPGSAGRCAGRSGRPASCPLRYRSAGAGRCPGRAGYAGHAAGQGAHAAIGAAATPRSGRFDLPDPKFWGADYDAGSRGRDAVDRGLSDRRPGDRMAGESPDQRLNYSDITWGARDILTQQCERRGGQQFAFSSLAEARALVALETDEGHELTAALLASVRQAHDAQQAEQPSYNSIRVVPAQSGRPGKELAGRWQRK